MSNNHHLSIQYLSEEDQKALHKIGRKLDSLRYFPTAAFRIIARNRHFQMFVPKERGGMEMDLPTASAIVEEYSYIDGNLGWIVQIGAGGDRKSTRLNSSHVAISYAVFCFNN